MSVVTGIDIAIAVILIGAALFGYMTGLVMEIAHLFCVAAAYIAAVAVVKLFSLQVASLVIFQIVFFIVYRLLRQLVKLLKIVDHIPVIGPINHIGGAIAGFLVNFIIIYIVCSIFFGIVPQEFLDNLGLTKSAIEGSLLLQAFY